eukprot:9318125-Pyramimonas_sp.AAC.1
MAHRTRRGSKDVPEYAFEMQQPSETARPSDPMVAIFKERDGSVTSVKIPNLTVKRWQAAARGEEATASKPSKGRDAANKGFRGTNAEGAVIESFLRNNNRKDHPPQRLVCIHVDGQQLFQIDTKHFKKGADQEELDKLAIKWGNSVAQKMADGELNNEEAFDLKKSFFELHGLKMQGDGKRMKKP